MILLALLLLPFMLLPAALIIGHLAVIFWPVTLIFFVIWLIGRAGDKAKGK